MSLVEEFASRYRFRLDGFQLEALGALERGESVLVTAPTGAGKTVVAEFACWLASRVGGKCFYTTPLKALSNQKFGDLVAAYGASRVGLLTGDNTINPAAPLVVMTTEVLRNMLYERSDALLGLAFVVLDEVHYLEDPERGGVWEEVIIHLPPEVRIIALSATVSNAEELAEWMRLLRGPVSLVREERRPVPLISRYMVGESLLDFFVYRNGSPTPNPAIARAERRLAPRRRARRDPRVPDLEDVVRVLEREGLLPAIYFIFSRAGCERAVRRLVSSGVRLTTPAEEEAITEYAEMRAAYIDPDDLAALGFGEWMEGLRRGLAAHHAGILPTFKETVEELFARGLIKLVFATETLSLGINMPARTVVLERLEKFTGEGHEPLSPGDYAQLTGRAGRRGIDEVGYGVVLYQPGVPFERIASLARAEPPPLRSAFVPGYNMAVNLLAERDLEEAAAVVGRSFAQFQADREVAQVEAKAARASDEAARLWARAECDRGEIREYWELLKIQRGLEAEEGRMRRERISTVRQELARLSPGDVVWVERGRKKGPALVLGNGSRGRVRAVLPGGRLGTLRPRDFPHGVEVVGRVPLPPSLTSGALRRQLVQEVSSFRPPRERLISPELASVRERLAAHPCSSCPELEEHLRWAARAARLESRAEGARRRARARAGSLARVFDRVVEILRRRGYLSGDRVTEKGRVLARLYVESDLLLAEAVFRGVLEDLSPEALAACLSCLVYEERGTPIKGELRERKAVRAMEGLERIAEELEEEERMLGLSLTRRPQRGFAHLAYCWAKGAKLEEVVAAGVSPGDFVRTSKQLLDLLRQLSQALPGSPLGEKARVAAELLNRGVVALAGAI